ncbi:TPA: conjugal transfer protein [Enterococcus faecium]
MSKASKFNPAGMHSQKLKQKKRKGRITRPFLLSTKAKIGNSRTLRFAPRTAANIYSILFFALFIVLVGLSVISFFRVNRLAELAMQKQVNETELVAEINQRLSATEQLKYEGQQFVQDLFTLEATDKGKEQWESRVVGRIAKGLNPQELRFTDTSFNRTVSQVEFIKLETLNEGEVIYQLFYDITYVENETTRKIQMILPVSYANQSFQLLEIPQIIRLSNKGEAVRYQPDIFSLKGEEVNEEEQEALFQFTQRFFELYVADGEQLSLISSLTGIGQGTLDNLEINDMVQDKQGIFHLQGIFAFHFDEESSLTSRFNLAIRANDEGYYVVKMNEQE